MSELIDKMLRQVENKIKRDCKEKSHHSCYLNRIESNLVLSTFEMVCYKVNADLPKASNGKPYKWFKVKLENRRGVFFVNFTLKQLRTETMNEFYKDWIHPD